MPETLGDYVRRRREAAGLTQEELAERAGLTAKGIGALEQGKRRRPYPDTVRRLAAALALSEEEFRALVAMTGPRSDREENASEERDAGGAARPALPGYLDRLIGRERAVAEALEQLRQPTTRLVSLTGPGGIGKTRLAVAVAAAARHAFADGVFFVPLAPVTDAEQVLPAIMQATGVSATPGRAPAEVLATAFRDRQVLLVLDNFEHVITVATAVTALLLACPRLKALVTSRMALRVRGELERRVEPLALPDVRSAHDPDAIMRAPAVELFVERARMVLPDFELRAADAPLLASVCARLDGLPLAIELAAARVALLPLPELLRRLEKCLMLLTSGPRDLPARQRTMRDAIDWSYALLDPADQTLFRRLAVFVGGCDLDAIEAVCGDDAALELLDGLTTLLDGNLARRVGGAREPRVEMLTTIHAYARERLDESGEAIRARQRHAAYYAALAEESMPRLTGADQVRWLDRLHVNRHNLHAALRSMLDGDEIPGVINMTWALWRYWWVRGQQREARRWMEEALARAADQATRLPSLARARALLGVGSMAWSEGKSAVAIDALREGLALAREGDDRRCQAIGQLLLGLALLEGDEPAFDQAETCFQTSLRLFNALGEAWGEAFALGYLGLIPLLHGRYDEAEPCFQRSLAVARAAADLAPSHQALYNLGLIAQARGNHGEAARFFSEGLRLASELGDIGNAGYFIKGLAQVAGFSGQMELAARLFSASEAALRATGSPSHRYVRTAHLDGQVLSQARAALGEERFIAAWRQGRALTLDEAISAARAWHGATDDVDPAEEEA